MKAKKIIEFIRYAFAFTVAIIYFPVWSLSFVFYYILKLLLALNYLLMLVVLIY